MREQNHSFWRGAWPPQGVERAFAWQECRMCGQKSSQKEAPAGCRDSSLHEGHLACGLGEFSCRVIEQRW